MRMDMLQSKRLWGRQTGYRVSAMRRSGNRPHGWACCAVPRAPGGSRRARLFVRRARDVSEIAYWIPVRISWHAVDWMATETRCAW